VGTVSLYRSLLVSPQFLAQGYKVGRVDQSETALGAEIRNKDAKAAAGKGKAKGGGKEIVRRELKSVLTTGTIVDGTMLTDDMSNHCVAIKVRFFSLFARKASSQKS
jgi:DNA mismatch repair protein MSH6